METNHTYYLTDMTPYDFRHMMMAWHEARRYAFKMMKDSIKKDSIAYWREHYEYCQQRIKELHKIWLDPPFEF